MAPKQNKNFFLIFFVCFWFFFAFWVTPSNAQGYSWLCAQELLLAVLRGPYGMLGIEPGSAACKANTLPAVQLLQPQDLFIFLDSHFIVYTTTLVQ